ncbi:hypothetical protein J3459_008136 [Metarhizium acridum]|uniref:uncharacterized protein n=1 Tax=Metarhizium acridum TaxID=92637 RepID=UPI001C6C9D04|nr:hypothetical protein J3458_001004 [Metarhizium acridum]KAG8426444.1 hypothetical protein J3459_008136 [Metarhizium acridum]
MFSKKTGGWQAGEKPQKTSGAAKNAPEKSLTCLLMHPSRRETGQRPTSTQVPDHESGTWVPIRLSRPHDAAARLKQRTPAEAWRSRRPEKFLQASNSRPIEARKSAFAFPSGFPA